MKNSSEIARVILFAGYVKGGSEVSLADLALLEELCRFGKVYCCFDNEILSETSVKRLLGIVEGVIVEKHGEYDFGSWKRSYLCIPQSVLASFDEMILVNNSMLIIDKLDQLFMESSKRPEQFFAPILVDEHYSGPVRFIEDYEAENDKFQCSVMYASVFWRMRSDLFLSGIFKNLLDSVRVETSRLDVCYNYERAFSRRLWRHGVSTSTLIPYVYKNVALYTETAFLLPSLGFPFIKYKVFDEQFYRIADLKSRCKALLLRTHADYRPLLQSVFLDRHISCGVA